MSGKGQGVTLNKGEKSTKLERLTVPVSLATAVREAAAQETDGTGVELAEWRRQAYREKLAKVKPIPDSESLK